MEFMFLQIFSIPMKLVGQTQCFRNAPQMNKFYLSGHGLTLQHIRYNSECNVYEELEPIDRNLNYDFNFQQINHLPREVTILPVSFAAI